MKILVTSIFTVGLFALGNLYAQQMTIATYNLRYSIEENYKRDSARGEDWVSRGPVAAAQIRFHEFEIFGTQECLLHQLEDLVEWLPGYKYIGVGRDDGKQDGEHAAIFYNTNRFRVIDKGDFWLSETPGKPSKGWDATCCNRLCSWALFEDMPTGSRFYVFNAHFDHQGVKARVESSKLVLQKIDEIAGDKPAIFMGDLNGDHDSEWYQLLAASDKLDDTFTQVDDAYAVNGSFNGFGLRTESNSIIDHVFVSRQFEAQKWGVLTDTFHGRFPSDHFPVVVKLILK
jgi:endonuclease/exonuclease/phosphatase family metal-dependent hydrolase